MQELPKGKDFGSNFCRIDGLNPDLPTDPEQVTPFVSIVPLSFVWVRVQFGGFRQAYARLRAPG
ncbi:MAG: hypothetical protein KDB01_14140 [Planctomycetaceae bacterium]|nr:hypothetical protein [Planctomycetaceae bacterium]